MTAFLDPTIKQLMPDPDVLTDMPAAADRIADAVVRGEQVAIFGDYDVDGARRPLLVATFLRVAGLDPQGLHPGPHLRGLWTERRRRSARSRGRAQRCSSPSIAAPPASSRSPRPRRLGLDTVVIDHHQADEALPEAKAIVNPNRLDDLSGLGHLAAVGLASS